jgi:hypothetical protein
MGAELVTELATGGNGGKGTGESATRESGREHHTRGPQAQVRGVLNCMENGVKLHTKISFRLQVSRTAPPTTASRFFLHVKILSPCIPHLTLTPLTPT